MLIRYSTTSVAALFLYACTPGGAGSTDDSGAGSETSAASGSTSGSTAVTAGSSSSGSDPTTTAGSTGSSTTSTATTDTTDATTGDATTDATSDATASTTTSSTTDASTGDASTGGDGLGPDAQAAIDALTEAVDGVIWPSESDYGWTVFGLPKAAPVTEGNVKQLVADFVEVEDVEPPLAEQGVEEEPWEDRFTKMTTPQPWWDAYNYMLADQYEALRTTLKAHLTTIKLFRIGPDNGGTLFGGIDMFVIGETADGDLVAIKTVSVET